MSLTPRASVTLLHSIAFVLLSNLTFGQSFTAAVRGTVKDPSGSSVPNATVIITDADRGTSQTTVADEAGRFAISALPPGNYVLAVEAVGSSSSRAAGSPSPFRSRPRSMQNWTWAS